MGTMEENENNEILVNFKISRVGSYNNSGHLTYLGTGGSYKNDVENDNFIKGNYLFCCAGNEIGDYSDKETSYRYDIDGDYDTTYGILVDSHNDLSSNELVAICEGGGLDILEFLGFENCEILQAFDFLREAIEQDITKLKHHDIQEVCFNSYSEEVENGMYREVNGRYYFVAE